MLKFREFRSVIVTFRKSMENSTFRAFKHQTATAVRAAAPSPRLARNPRSLETGCFRVPFCSNPKPMDAVLDYLKQNESRFIATLFDYIRFPSVSAQPKHQGDMAACARWLVKHCQEIGLEAQLCPTPGNPVVLAKTPRPNPSKNGRSRPSFLVYGHYDVQPPEPFDLWKTPPFEPTLQGRSIFARGASDNKGQNLAHLNAVEAYLKTGTPLPCDLTFVLEGEEEVGSANLANFLRANRKELDCEAVVISDTGMPSLDQPALVYALRGIAAFEIEIFGPSRDLHSGIFGGTVENPAMALSQMLAACRDKNGKIKIPGFYNDVRPLSAYERKECSKIPLPLAQYKKLLGVPELFGEKGYSPMEQRSSRPTFEINGLTSGYQGEGSKTIVPCYARAKVTCRLVPDQEPEKILLLVQNYLKKICPSGVRLKVTPGHHGTPYLVSPKGVHARAALETLRQAFGAEPVLMREGGSIPIVSDFKSILGADTLLLGLALPDDNAHSPNEKFSLDCYRNGMRMGAILWQELAKAASAG
jgi:acetylornithine deacetylase/succinyl-diaminopimelate desuccinylase-like protein